MGELSIITRPQQFQYYISNVNDSILCFPKPLTTSAGIWHGDNPLASSVSLFFTQISIIFATTRITHAVLRHLGQPQVVSHTIAGLILGPSCLSRSKSFKNLMFPERSLMHLHLVSHLAFILYCFVIGVKTDIKLLKKSSRKAFYIAEFGTIFPFVFITVAGLYLRSSFSMTVNYQQIFFQYGVPWCVTSYTVLSSLLDELNLLSSELGRLSLSASLIGDVQTTVLCSMLMAIVLTRELSDIYTGLLSLVSFVFFVMFILNLARPLTLWMIKRTPEGAKMDETHFLAVVLLAIASGLLGAFIGQQIMIGPILLGFVIPGGPPLGSILEEKLDVLILKVLLSTYLALAGIKTDLSLIFSGNDWPYVVLLIVISIGAKFICVMLSCLYAEMDMRSAIIVALMMCTKGIVELYVFNDIENLSTTKSDHHAINIVSIVIIAGLSASLLKLIYNSSVRFTTQRRSTIEHFYHGEELRVVACIHHETNVPPVIELLNATNATRNSCLSVYLIHLVQILGHNAAVFASYKPKNKKYKSRYRSDTQHIVNALKSLERKNRKNDNDTENGITAGITIMPFISISRYISMHEDICSLALDKRASLVIIPFHRSMEINGAAETTNPAIQIMNINVLTYAPCSVGILIGRRIQAQPLNTQLQHKIVVYFLGGPDDREALALGSRMAEINNVSITLVRFLPPKTMREENKIQTRLDNEAVSEFMMTKADGKLVEYKEEVVTEGAGTVAAIRSMSNEYTLLIVGREQAEESPLTAGLEVWSEYPELGIIGDILASTDFGGNVSTLVVQQHGRNPKEAKTVYKMRQKVTSKK